MEIALHQSSSTKTWFVKVGGEELMDVIGQVSICFWPYSVFYNKSDENLIRNKKKIHYGIMYSVLFAKGQWGCWFLSPAKQKLYPIDI